MKRHLVLDRRLRWDRMSRWQMGSLAEVQTTPIDDHEEEGECALLEL